MGNNFVNDEFLANQAAINQQVRDRSGVPLGGNGNGQPIATPPPLRLILPCVLNEPLDAATHGKRGASAMASVCGLWDDTVKTYQEYTDDELTPDKETEPDWAVIEVYNHSEITDHEEGTLGLAILAGWPVSHYWFLGDCAALSTRAAPTDPPSE